MLYWESKSRRARAGAWLHPYGKMVFNKMCVCPILVILSILMVACDTEKNPSGKGSTPTPIPSPTSSGSLLDVAPPSTPLVCPGQQNKGPSDFVSKDGSTFVYHGSPITFYGYTSYPGSIGGASAWHKPDFTRYIDHIMQMGSRVGQNL